MATVVNVYNRQHPPAQVQQAEEDEDGNGSDDSNPGSGVLRWMRQRIDSRYLNRST